MSRGILNKPGRVGTEIFPEDAKELARKVGLTEMVWVLKSEPIDDGGGSYKPNWHKKEPSFRARFDSYKRAKPRGIVADQINEFTDHIVTMDRTADIVAQDRLLREADNTTWEVVAVEKRTDQPTIQLQVKQL